MIEDNDKCPCGSGKTYQDCCYRFVSKEALPETAEQLMRSRFSAFVKKDGQYLFETHHPHFRGNLTEKKLQKSAEMTDWTRLVVMDHLWTEGSKTAEVEFKAFFEDKGKEIELHERSSFVLDGKQWYYTEGIHDPKPQTTSKEIVGRNDPCPCGSGKKYKKCCGK